VLAVAVPVIATDQDGRNVSGLAASDFRIFEDGAEQPLQHFVEVSEPLNLALLLDTSVSMKERYVNIRAAASAFVDRLRPGDRAMVVSFDDRAYLGCELTADRAEIQAALQRTRIGGRLSQLFDSVETVLSERLDPVEGRKAIVLFTDGVDVGSSFATDRTTIQRVQASNTPVYVVQYDTRRDPQVATMSVRRRGGTTGPESPVMYFDNAGTYERADRFVAEIARESGGLAQRASTIDEIAASLSRISDDLRWQYVLYYYPPKSADGAFHAIRVEVVHPGVRVRTRTGYRSLKQ